MAKRSGLGMRLYVQGYDISGDVGAISTIRSSTAGLDVTGLDKTAMERLAGMKDGEVSFNVFFDDDTDAAHDALSGLPTTDVLAMVLMGTTAGDPVFAISAKQINYDWNRDQSGALTGTVQLLGAAGHPLESGILLTAKTTHASAADETGLDHGAQTTDGAVGFLQHFDADSGTVEYDIEDSADSTDGNDGTWGNLIAFSDVATPYTQTAERVEVDGDVERWVRASTNGTFTNADFAMAFRRRFSNDFDAA